MIRKVIAVSLLLMNPLSQAISQTDSGFHYKVEGDGGVSRTVVKTWSMDDPKSPKATWVTTVSAQAFNTNAAVNRPVRASGRHQACWNNNLLWSVTASYVYTINANGKTVRVTNRFNLPMRTIKCITQDTYIITAFPMAGNFQYNTATHAETNLTVPHDAMGNAYLMVR